MEARLHTKFGNARMECFTKFLLYVWYTIKLYVIGVLALLCQLLYRPSSVKGQQSVSGRTAIVTGGSSGIGYHISKLLACHGARVVIASRCRKGAEDAIAQILKACPGAEVDFIHLDLSSFKSVRRFVDEFLMRGWPLHLLINNAGVMLVPYQLTKDGHEYHLQVNHLSHALLTSLLLNELELSCTDTQPSHVISVTSVVHHVASLDPDTFGEKCEWSYSPHNAYAASKLAIILYTKALQRHLEEKQSNVMVSAVHPGIVNTGLYQHIHWAIAWAFNIMKKLLFMKPEEAAMSVLHLAMSADREITSGGYYSNGRPAAPSSQSSIHTFQETVFKKTCQMTESKLD